MISGHPLLISWEYDGGCLGVCLFWLFVLLEKRGWTKWIVWGRNWTELEKQVQRFVEIIGIRVEWIWGNNFCVYFWIYIYILNNSISLFIWERERDCMIEEPNYLYTFIYYILLLIHTHMHVYNCIHVFRIHTHWHVYPTIWRHLHASTHASKDHDTQGCKK